MHFIDKGITRIHNRKQRKGLKINLSKNVFVRVGETYACMCEFNSQITKEKKRSLAADILLTFNYFWKQEEKERNRRQCLPFYTRK